MTLSKENISIFTIWLFTISALIGIYIGYLDWFIPKTPINLLLGAVLLFLIFPINTSKKITVWLIAFSIGMLVEILGVQTGTIFGEYNYGNNLGAKLLGVPYLIGINWAVLTFTTAAISNRLSNNFLSSICIGAGLMVGLDLLMEPLAAIFDFWYFKDGIIPIQNYVAWFLIALLLQYIFQKTITTKSVNFAAHLFFSQIVFFASCNLMLS